MTIQRICVAAVLATLGACGDDFSYQDDWDDGDTLIVDGKTDSLLDEAPVLHLGATGKGYVEGTQLDVYALDLKKGDQVRLVESVTGGDLAPHFQLYFGGADKVGSTSYTATARKLTKRYTLTASGRYYVVVKPYHGSGKGNYELATSCTGGTCAGELPPPDRLSIEQQGACLETARQCAFARLPAFGGAVGAARARTIYQSCVAEARVDELSCVAACDSAEGKTLCDAIIGDLPFYADASASCLANLDECMTSCMDSDPGERPRDVGETAIGMCWENGYNRTCNGYARDTRECGGTLRHDSDAACLALCEATFGAWNDDLDTVCSEQCS